MSSAVPRGYEFGDFQLDVRAPALYFQGELLDGGEKLLRVLEVFLRHPDRLVSYNGVIDEVWGEDNFGVTSDHVNKSVSQIRAILANYDPDREYFQNKKGRGYVFCGPVETLTDVPDGSSVTPPAASPPARRDTRRSKVLVVVGIIAALLLLALVEYWVLYRSSDDAEIRRVVRDSQGYESLVLYAMPQEFKDEDLDRYWTRGPGDQVNSDRRRIRESVIRLQNEGRHYGPETKNEQFDFQSVEIDKDRRHAVVRTLETWFIAIYGSDGKLIENKTVGPYFVSYVLQNDAGHWLIEKSNTGRMIRPKPAIDDVTFVPADGSGTRPSLKIVGEDLEPETITMEIIGPGCDASNPCKLANLYLRTNAGLSETAIEKLPFDYGSGVFTITVRNGDSPPSSPFSITVP